VAVSAVAGAVAAHRWGETVCAEDFMVTLPVFWR